MKASSCYTGKQLDIIINQKNVFTNHSVSFQKPDQWQRRISHVL